MIKDKEKWRKGQLSYRSLMSHEVIRAKDVLGQQPKSTGRTDYFFVLNPFMFKEPRTGQLTSFYPPWEPPVWGITFTLWFPFRSMLLIFIKPSVWQ